MLIVTMSAWTVVVLMKLPLNLRCSSMTRKDSPQSIAREIHGDDNETTTTTNRPTETRGTRKAR